jgi:hypothetical protein
MHHTLKRRQVYICSWHLNSALLTVEFYVTLNKVPVSFADSMQYGIAFNQLPFSEVFSFSGVFYCLECVT